ncbi:atp-dependent dna helicase [Pyrenophora seminiperda CCB06]|uniref:Atp-dependent dna helicase n=1 Tax=Pyrenophora seminiperda CCB06 TaxID=1302712 RepID=A0A3M7MGK4_9PLEO|nr:atp-dependent dna helicase [Pyrenophora seminiperda CCB06]
MSSEDRKAMSLEDQPIEHIGSAPWSFHISSHDVSKMIQGFTPQEMGQRWMCKTDGPNSHGDIEVHFCRSWTGDECFRMRAKGDENGAEVIEIKWHKGNEDAPTDEDEAKRTVVNFTRGLLGCQLGEAPEELMETV